MSSDLSRRQLFGLAGAGMLAGSLPRSPKAQEPAGGGQGRGAVAIASGNGLGAVHEAHKRATAGQRPVHAAVMGVAIQENDPRDVTVGLGGLPNEDGVVQLDAACMDGPTHNAGSVASLEGFQNPAQVAEKVMWETDHVLLVGDGAARFARSYGFEEKDLLTPRTRRLWLNWRARRSDQDDYLEPLETVPGVEIDQDKDGNLRPYGTIHCSVLNAQADLGCSTTTSGLAYKIPGRVGDSPLIGAGLYCDNEAGSAGATGRGEAAILSGGSWLVVERMRAGDDPVEACLHALRRIASQVQRQGQWQPALQKGDRPAFNICFYAVRKDGRYGCARMFGAPNQKNFAVCDDGGARHESAAFLFTRS